MNPTTLINEAIRNGNESLISGDYDKVRWRIKQVHGFEQSLWNSLPVSMQQTFGNFNYWIINCSEAYKLQTKLENKTKLKENIIVIQEAKNETDDNKIKSSDTESIIKGNSEFENKNYDEALKHYQKAIKINSKSFIGFYKISLCLVKLQLFVEAISSFESYVSLAPESHKSNIDKVKFFINKLREKTKSKNIIPKEVKIVDKIEEIKDNPKYTSIIEKVINYINTNNDNGAMSLISDMYEILNKGSIYERKKSANLLRMIPPLKHKPTVDILLSRLKIEDNKDVLANIIFALRGLEASNAVEIFKKMLNDQRYIENKTDLQEAIDYFN